MENDKMIDNKSNDRIPFPLIMIVLFVSPLCIYLQTLTFANTNIYSTVYILVSVALGMLYCRGKIYVGKGNAIVVAFLILMALHSLLGGSLLYCLQTILLIILLTVSFDIYDIEKGLVILEIVGVVCAIGCIFQYFFYSSYISIVSVLFKQSALDSIQRLFRWDKSTCGFMPQTSHAAGCILVALYITIFKDKGKKRLLFICKTLILVIALLLTNKRAHFAFGFIGLLMAFLSGENHNVKVKRILTIFVIGSIAVTIAYVYLPSLNPDSTIASLFYTIQNINNSDVDVTSDRLALGQEAIDMIKRSPFIGNGWGSFKLQSAFRTDAHNVYLQLFAEAGVFALALFVIIILKGIFDTARELKYAVVNGNSFETILKISFSYQMFFALYCLTGNCLYNIDFWAVYVLMQAITLGVRRRRNNEKLSYNN